MAAGDDKPLIVVTGASGFLAAHVVHQLLEAGYRVRGTVRDPKNKEKTEQLRTLPGAEENLELVAADLTTDDGWDELCVGAAGLIHTASPFVLDGTPEAELMRAAVGGVERALASAKKAGLKRVVLTSSTVAVMTDEDRPVTEKDFSDPEKQSNYAKSKTAAELRAWDLAKEEPTLDLTVINPSFIMGPTVSRKTNMSFTSASVIRQMLTGALPYTPDMAFMECDVRDVATAHIRAFQTPESIGERIIVAYVPSESDPKTSDAAERIGSITFLRMAQILREHFGPNAYRRIPTQSMSHGFTRFVGLFNGQVSAIVPNLGKRPRTTSTKLHDMLGFSVRHPRESIPAMAEALIRNGSVPDETEDKRYSGTDDEPPKIDHIDLIKRK